MATPNKIKNGLLKKIDETTSTKTENTESPIVDTQVKPTRSYAPRRSYDTAYKLRILSAYDACETPSERGALLRKEGLYSSRLYAWKQQRANAKLSDRKKSSNTLLRTDYLTRENEQLKKKLAQAEAIIDLQKKVSDLFGTHILAPKQSEVNS